MESAHPVQRVREVDKVRRVMLGLPGLVVWQVLKGIADPAQYTTLSLLHHLNMSTRVHVLDVKYMK